MTISNLYDTEQLIVDKITPLFGSNMVFIEAESQTLGIETFTEKDCDGDRVAALVLNAGFRADPLFGANKKQKLKTLWEVAVVCPRALYKINGGVKLMEVIQLLKGWRVSPEIGTMEVVDDERGFNRPDFVQDLVYLPTMFMVSTVI